MDCLAVWMGLSFYYCFIGQHIVLRQSPAWGTALYKRPGTKSHVFKDHGWMAFTYRRDGTAYRPGDTDQSYGLVLLDKRDSTPAPYVWFPLPFCCHSHVVVFVGTCFVVGVGRHKWSKSASSRNMASPSALSLGWFLKKKKKKLTWHREYCDQQGSSPRSRLSHCTSVKLKPTIPP